MQTLQLEIVKFVPSNVVHALEEQFLNVKHVN